MTGLTRSITVSRLTAPVTEDDIEGLARLLVSAVEAGAAVSFLDTLTIEAACEWWRRTIDAAHPRAIFMVARSDGRLVGTVQLQPAWAPNQPHRGEIVKLLVDPASQNQGLGAALMRTIETAARDAGFRLLTLDAKAGGAADRLYRRLGWRVLGQIPDYALDPDGVTPHPAIFFFKPL